MDSRLRAAQRAAIAEPDDGTARLLYAWQLLRARFLAAARHELAVAKDLGAVFPAELVERAAFLDGRGVEWSFVDPGHGQTWVAPLVEDTRLVGALVCDGERLVPPPLVEIVCRECVEGTLPCRLCDEDDSRDGCTICKRTKREVCGACDGSMLDRSRLRPRSPRSCLHSTRVEEKALHHRWSWYMERCVSCRLVGLREPDSQAFTAGSHVACPDCGFLGCRCEIVSGRAG